MTQDNLVLYLIVITFGLAMAFGAYQWWRASKAKREHHHSVAERQEGPDHPKPRKESV
jgi:Flp pilus assembly protein TadB